MPRQNTRRRVLKRLGASAAGLAVLSSPAAAASGSESDETTDDVAVVRGSMELTDKNTASDKEVQEFKDKVAERTDDGVSTQVVDPGGTVTTPETDNLESTGYEWTRLNKEATTATGATVAKGDFYINEWRYKNNPYNGKDWYFYQVVALGKPQSAIDFDGNIYDVWTQLKTQNGNRIESMGPKDTKEGDSKQIGVNIGGAAGDNSTNVNGGLSYQFTLTEDRYQLHPEKTTLTKAFAPQWVGDSEATQTAAGGCLVHRDEGDSRDLHYEWYLKGGKYAKTV